jgi:hypothetical protein
VGATRVLIPRDKGSDQVSQHFAPILRYSLLLMHTGLFHRHLFVKSNTYVKSGKRTALDVNFEDFLRLLPNLEALSFFWDPPTVMKHLSARGKSLNVAVREKRLRERPFVSGTSSVTEVRLWVKQENVDIKEVADLLQFSTLRRLRLGFESWKLLNETDRDSSLKSLLEMCHAFRASNLDRAGLELHLRMDHLTKEIDVCVSTIS